MNWPDYTAPTCTSTPGTSSSTRTSEHFTNTAACAGSGHPRPPHRPPLLRQHLERHDNEFVFTNSRGNWLWHSDTSRRGLRPAADGNLDLPSPRIRTSPVRPGLTFHGLRHSHKTWLITSAVPEIAQSRRLGHHLSDRVTEVYSHVAPEVEQRLLNALQQRWLSATKKCRTHPMPPTPARHGNETA